MDQKELLPTSSKDRKKIPLATGVFDYFPAALAEIAKVSFQGNEQHNPGEPLHWARGKSTDQADTMLRHFVERGTLDSDGMRHSAKMCWRALAILELELEAEGAPVARGAKIPVTESPVEKLYTQAELDDQLRFVNECNARQADIIGKQREALEKLQEAK